MGRRSQIEVVKKFRTPDGREHDTREAAEQHMVLCAQAEELQAWADELDKAEPLPEGMADQDGIGRIITVAEDLPRFLCAHRTKLLQLMNATGNEEIQAGL
jgi:hypothetical protein